MKHSLPFRLIHFALIICMALALLLTACGTAGSAPTADITLPATEAALPPETAVSTEPAVPTAAPSPSMPAADTQAPTSPAAPDAGSTEAIPQTCSVSGQQTYVDTGDGYCFAYPDPFTLGESSSSGGMPGLFGPALDESPEPVRASLGITAQPVPAGSDLSRLVGAFLSQTQFQGLPWEISRTPILLGGEPAEVLEDVPGRLSSRLVMAVHGETLYTLTFWPSDLPDVELDLEALFEAVTGSFAFVERTSPPQAAAGPQTASWYEFDRNISFTYDPSLAVWMEAWTVPAVPASPDLMYVDSHPAQVQFRFLGFKGGRVYQLPYPLWDARVMVFRTGDFPGFGEADYPQSFPNQQKALADLLQKGLDPDFCVQPLTGEGQPQSLPFLPWVNSTQTFCAQPQLLEFPGGKGIRYLTYFAQGVSPVLDNQVFYTYQGLTDDGQFYISAVFPVSTGVFPTEPPEEIVSKQEYHQAWLSTLAEQLDQLNALPQESFDPSLEVYDALVRSIRIEKP